MIDHAMNNNQPLTEAKTTSKSSKAETMMVDDRNLTDADAKAIATEIKRQIMQDFRIEVGSGVLTLAKKAMIWVLILLAIYGLTQSPGFFANAHLGQGSGS